MTTKDADVAELPDRFFRSKDLSDAEKLVLARLYAYTNTGDDAPIAFPKVADLADCVGKAQKTVEKLLGSLRKRGYVRRGYAQQEGSKPVLGLELCARSDGSLLDWHPRSTEGYPAEVRARSTEGYPAEVRGSPPQYCGVLHYRKLQAKLSVALTAETASRLISTYTQKKALNSGSQKANETNPQPPPDVNQVLPIADSETSDERDEKPPPAPSGVSAPTESGGTQKIESQASQVPLIEGLLAPENRVEATPRRTKAKRKVRTSADRAAEKAEKLKLDARKERNANPAYAEIREHMNAARKRVAEKIGKSDGLGPQRLGVWTAIADARLETGETVADILAGIDALEREALAKHRRGDPAATKWLNVNHLGAPMTGAKTRYPPQPETATGRPAFAGLH